LARALENRWWARAVRANSRSARWWKRLECARFLSVVATTHDVGRVLRLLRDRHPAVQLAAATTLERVGSPVLVTAALEQLPFLGDQDGTAGPFERRRGGELDGGVPVAQQPQHAPH